jgi:hypothetical protein
LSLLRVWQLDGWRLTSIAARSLVPPAGLVG